MASQFSRYLLETTGSFDRDTNARASAVKINKNSYSRAFVALYNGRELRCPNERKPREGLQLINPRMVYHPASAAWCFSRDL